MSATPDDLVELTKRLTESLERATEAARAVAERLAAATRPFVEAVRQLQDAETAAPCPCALANGSPCPEHPDAEPSGGAA